MKISKSKQELARIISENGGWKAKKAGWSAQDGSDGQVSFFKIKAPTYSKPEKEWMAFGDSVHCYDSRIEGCKVVKNFHQTILSREEYFHLYPAPDADGWIEWSGGECPVGKNISGDIKLACGEEFFTVDMAIWNWQMGNDCPRRIIAYRLHKPEQSEPEFCESVMRSIPEPEINSKNINITQVDDIDVVESKPTIEQLASDYRNAKDYAERKQREADDAKDGADARLKALEIAAEDLGFKIEPITTKQDGL